MFRKTTRRETGRTRPDHSPMQPIPRKSGNTMDAAIRDAHSDFTDAYQMYIMHWR